MAPTTPPGGAGNQLQVAAIDDVLGYLYIMRRRMPMDDLVKLVCEYYSKEDIVKARDTYYRILPEQPTSKIRRKCSRPMGDNIATILDLMQETSAEAHLPLVCRYACHTPSTRLGSIDVVALHSQCSTLMQEVRGMERRLTQGLNSVTMTLAEHRSLLDQISARFSFWDKTMDGLARFLARQGQGIAAAKADCQCGSTPTAG